MNQQPTLEKTLAEHLADFTDIANNDHQRAKTTIATYACYIRAFVAYCGDGAVTDMFTARNLQQFKNTFVTTTRPSQNTIRLLVYGLRAFGKYLVETEAVPKPNPASDLPAPKAVRGTRVHVPDEHARALLAACSRFADDKQAAFAKAMLSVLIHAGLRYSEFNNLRLADVNLDRREIFVAHGKGDKARTVPICDAACEALREFLRFRHPHAQIDWFWMRNAWVRYSRRSVETMLTEVVAMADLKGVRYTPHCFRHGYISGLIMAGADVKSVSEMAGHSSSAVTIDVYTHTTEKQKRRVAELSETRMQPAITAQAARRRSVEPVKPGRSVRQDLRKPTPSRRVNLRRHP